MAATAEVFSVVVAKLLPEFPTNSAAVVVSSVAELALGFPVMMEVGGGRLGEAWISGGYVVGTSIGHLPTKLTRNKN